MVLLLALLIGIGGTYFYEYEAGSVYTNDAQIMGFETKISTDIGPYRLEELFFDEGDLVRKDTVLARLDSSLITPEFEKAKATVLQQKAEIIFRQAARMKVKDDYERASNGFRDKIISVQDLDHATRDLEMANAALELAVAQLEVAEKQMAYLATKLVHTELKAPMNGQIAKRWQWKGNVISKGQAVFSLYDLDNVWVLANLQETDVARIRLGDSVWMLILDFSLRGVFSPSKGRRPVNFLLFLPTMPPATTPKLSSAFRSKSLSRKKRGINFTSSQACPLKSAFESAKDA